MSRPYASSSANSAPMSISSSRRGAVPIPPRDPPEARWRYRPSENPGFRLDRVEGPRDLLGRGALAGLRKRPRPRKFRIEAPAVAARHVADRAGALARAFQGPDVGHVDAAVLAEEPGVEADPRAGRAARS